MEKLKPAISGKVVIVTGASSGIGESTAREFAQAGARVVLVARRVNRLEHLAQEIERSGGVALAVPTDLTHSHQIKDLVEKTLDAFGRIDILVNIAGWGHYDWFEELTHETLRKQYEVNIIAMGELIRQVLPTMKAQHSGMIINMSSYSSRISVPPLTVYSSTKSAVDGLTDGLRRELLPWGITVMRVHPSAVTGTEFKKKAVADGGLKYQSPALGQVTCEYVAQKIVELVEHPQHSLYLGKLYSVPVTLNRVVPSLIDRVSAYWVRSKRKKELSRNARSSLAERRLSWLSWAFLPLGVLFLRVLLRMKFRS